MKPDVPEPPEGAQPIGDLTETECALLAHLTTLVIQRSLKQPWARSYQRVSEALGSIADDGDVDLVGTPADVWVLIRGTVIVHAARDWLAWQALQVDRHEARN